MRSLLMAPVLLLLPSWCPGSVFAQARVSRPPIITETRTYAAHNTCLFGGGRNVERRIDELIALIRAQGAPNQGSNLDREILEMLRANNALLLQLVQQNSALLAQRQGSNQPIVYLLTPGQPRQVLKPNEAPRQVLPPNEAPRQVLPPNEAPRQVLPPDEAPRQVLPPNEAPRQVLPPRTYYFPVTRWRPAR